MDHSLYSGHHQDRHEAQIFDINYQLSTVSCQLLMTLETALDRYLEMAVFEAGLSEATLSAYGADLRRYIGFLSDNGVTSAEEVVREDVLDHLGALIAGIATPFAGPASQRYPAIPCFTG